MRRLGITRRPCYAPSSHAQIEALQHSAVYPSPICMCPQSYTASMRPERMPFMSAALPPLLA